MTLGGGASRSLPVHFFTIVLNGEPFIRHHVEQFKQLPFAWRWHIMEGVAELKHDTAWSLRTGGRIPDALHRNGLSIDGTSEYLDQLTEEFPENVTVYRKNGLWDGKREMVSVPLGEIKGECLLWQVDADEIWRAEQLVKGREMFLREAERMAAFYLCRYLVGPDRVITTRDGYGNHRDSEWLRTWRYRPGMIWAAHEPPVLAERFGENEWRDVARVNSFTRDETEREGLVFEHHAYVTLQQVQFKQSYYGYSGAVAGWLALQGEERLPKKLREYFPWVRDEAMVDSVGRGMPGYEFAFRPQADRSDKTRVKNIVYVRTDAIGDAVLGSATLEQVARAYPNAKVSVVCQERVAPLYEHCPLVGGIISYDEQKLSLREYCNGLRDRLHGLNADLCISGVYSRTNVTDFFVSISGARERVGFHGDLANLTPRERDDGDLAYSQFVLSAGRFRAELDRQRDLLKSLRIEADSMLPRVWTSEADARAAEEIFAAHGLDSNSTIAMWCGARFEVRHAAQIGAALKAICERERYRVVALGGEGDRAINGTNLAEVGCNSVDLTGQTPIQTSAEIIRRCRLAVGVETSLAHLACAVGTPNVILLGGGHFGRFMPYSALTTVVCLPIQCYGCNWLCRYERPYCVRDVDARVIAAAVEAALAGEGPRARIFAQDRSSWVAAPGKPAWSWFHPYVKRAAVDVSVVDVSRDGVRVRKLRPPDRHAGFLGMGSWQVARRDLGNVWFRTTLPGLERLFRERVMPLMVRGIEDVPACENEAVILDELLAGLGRGPGDAAALYYQVFWPLYLKSEEAPEWVRMNLPKWAEFKGNLEI